jgi:uncharacterized protein (DUF362 family)
MDEKRVFILKSDWTAYPTPPFHPAEHFPELDIEEIDKKNKIYGLVRETLYGLRMDRDNFGGPNWNPLGEIVKPGDKVVLKPNLVLDMHDGGRHGVEAMITHASILRPVIDYVLKASKGTARITICDASLQSASWDKMIKENYYQDLVVYFRNRGVNIELLDLRIIQAYCNKYGGIEKTIKLPGDPRGYCVVDLGGDSCFGPILSHSEKLEITGYPSGTVAQHHNHKKNEYLISRTILESDVFINLPKMKTHRKAGVSLSLKNIIGINADKSWIAHHRRGSIRNGGDEFDTQPLRFKVRLGLIHYLRRFRIGVLILQYFFSPLKGLISTIKNSLIQGRKYGQASSSTSSRNNGYGIVTEGSWYRNDTLWRTILDLNRCLFYADSNGELRPEKQRRYFTLLDGILGMKGEGPMEGTPKEAGCLVAAYSPVASDYVTASIMGMEPGKIPSIRECFKIQNYRLIDFGPEEIIVDSNFPFYKDLVHLDWKDSLKFMPPKNWQGHIERQGFHDKWEELPGFPESIEANACCFE